MDRSSINGMVIIWDAQNAHDAPDYERHEQHVNRKTLKHWPLRALNLETNPLSPYQKCALNPCCVKYWDAELQYFCVHCNKIPKTGWYTAAFLSGEGGVRKPPPTLSLEQAFSNIKHKTAAASLFVQIILFSYFVPKHWRRLKRANGKVLKYDESR